VKLAAGGQLEEEVCRRSSPPSALSIVHTPSCTCPRLRACIEGDRLEERQLISARVAEQERKVLGSRRLARAMAKREAEKARSQDEKNESLAFDSMINSLQSMFGRDGFRGKDAEKALQELKEVQIMAKAEESEEKRLLGSKRVYKFVRAATRTIQRPVRRKNHPGEVYDSRSGHR